MKTTESKDKICRIDIDLTPSEWGLLMHYIEFRKEFLAGLETKHGAVDKNILHELEVRDLTLLRKKVFEEGRRQMDGYNQA